MLFYPAITFSEQSSDDSFQFKNDIPAFLDNDGPNVCIDEAHNNYHTAEGRYKPFANMLRHDGFNVSRFTNKFSQENLKKCDVLVIANALSPINEKEWRYPHFSAFNGNEIIDVKNWVRSGGSLLIFADHAPLAGAARDLGAVIGLLMADVYALNDPHGKGKDIFSKEQNTLHDHSITRGRNSKEAIDQVTTFTGQPALISQFWKPLLTFRENALAYIDPDQASLQLATGEDPPIFSLAGWSHAATREWDKGRIVFIGEAALCSAQLSEDDNEPMGMNSSLAKQNPQFCLNVVRWLTRILN